MFRSAIIISLIAIVGFRISVAIKAIEEFFKGKEKRYIFLFGPKASGKTTLSKFLNDPNSVIYNEYKETVESGEYKVNITKYKSLRLGELNYELRLIDNPGSVNTRKLPTQLYIIRRIREISQLRPTPIVFYLFDLSRIDDQDYVEIIQRDIELFIENLRSTYIIIIANKLDLFLSKRKNLKNIDIDKEISKIVENIFRQSKKKDYLNLLKKQNKVAIVIGSLKNKDLASTLVAKAFNTLVKLAKEER